MNTPTRSQIIASLLEPDPPKPVVLAEDEFTLEALCKELGKSKHEGNQIIKSLRAKKRIVRVRMVHKGGYARVAVYKAVKIENDK